MLYIIITLAYLYFLGLSVRIGGNFNFFLDIVSIISFCLKFDVDETTNPVKLCEFQLRVVV